MEDISAVVVPQLLTRIRGMVRRAPKGVQKEQLKLLAWQLCQHPPVKFIQRQIGIIAGVSGK